VALNTYTSTATAITDSSRLSCVEMNRKVTIPGANAAVGKVRRTLRFKDSTVVPAVATPTAVNMMGSRAACKLGHA
jgi:hypothetical protein